MLVSEVAAMTTDKEKAASPCQGEAATKDFHKSNLTPLDPLQGWFGLAKSAKVTEQYKHQFLKQKRGTK